MRRANPISYSDVLSRLHSRGVANPSCIASYIVEECKKQIGKAWPYAHIGDWFKKEYVDTGRFKSFIHFHLEFDALHPLLRIDTYESMLQRVEEECVSELQTNLIHILSAIKSPKDIEDGHVQLNMALLTPRIMEFYALASEILQKAADEERVQEMKRLQEQESKQRLRDGIISLLIILALVLLVRAMFS